MIEENELFAGKFWRTFDKKCRKAFVRGDDSNYERASLLALFMWNWRDRPDVHSSHPTSDMHPQETPRGWQEAISRLHEFLGTEEPELWLEPRVSAGFYDRALECFGELPTHQSSLVAYVFDYRFLRLAAHETGTHRHVSHFSASLVNAIFGGRVSFLDALSTTGEVFATGGNERWRRGEDRLLRYYLYQLGGLEAEVRMRLALHQMNPKSYRRVEADKFQQFPSTIVRISLPAPRSMPALARDFPFKKTSSAAVLYFAIRSNLNLQNAVVMVSGSERTSLASKSRAPRERLLIERNVLAVVDLPRPTGAKGDSSAWILGGPESQVERGVLMIDLTGLGKATSHQDFGALAEFSGRLVRRFLGEEVSARWATSSREDGASQIRHVFDREFARGYTDVDGLCRCVATEEILQNDAVLAASRYIRSSDKSAWLSGIDGSPLITRLLDVQNRGQCIYLIGNNGQGKSLLLREVAKSMGNLRPKVVGISCSASDRFPHPAEREPGFEHFIYEGARTSNQAANHRQAATEVCRKFVSIHCSVERLEVFLRVLRLLEFDAKRFLMPLVASGESSLTDDVLERTIQLSDEAAQNLDATNRPSMQGMQIALMRFGSSGGITAFRDLSSGEQQIVSLVVKLVFHATQNCLFLIDEPEISLHVSWQRVLPKVLATIASAFACDVLVATHSPLLISSTSGEGATCFVANAQRLKQVPDVDTRSVESILFKGFGTYTPNNRSIHERCASIVAEAMEVMNQEGSVNKSTLDSLMNELGDMRRTVTSAIDLLNRPSVDMSLELIRRARESLLTLAALHAHLGVEDQLGGDH